MSDDLRVLSDIFLLVGFLALGAGFLWRNRRAHLLRSIGWAVFAVFWIVQVPGYISIDDLLNVLGSVAAFAIFLYLGYHEYLSFKWDDEYEPLRFVAGAAFVASTIYFVFDRIPQLSAWLIETVTQHTAGFLGILGMTYSAGPANLAGNPLWYRTNGEEIFAPLLNSSGQPVVEIVLACTAIQGLAIAAAMILSVREPPKRKAIAFLVVIPATYITNLVRNVVVIYFFDVQHVQFELVHGYWGKGLAVAVLVVLVVFSFWILPELYVNINGLFELPWRKGPKHDYKKYVGRLYRREKEPTTPATSSERISSSPPDDSSGEPRTRP